MVWLLPGILLVALLAAAAYDLARRRRGETLRSGRELSRESMHHRVDIHAVPYEPARHAGQRDWATYRRRDRHRRG